MQIASNTDTYFVRGTNCDCSFVAADRNGNRSCLQRRDQDKRCSVFINLEVDMIIDNDSVIWVNWKSRNIAEKLTAPFFSIIFQKYLNLERIQLRFESLETSEIELQICLSQRRKIEKLIDIGIQQQGELSFFFHTRISNCKRQ
jgi:hypothetical protein